MSAERLLPNSGARGLFPLPLARLLAALALCLMMIASGCAEFRASAPQGFAPYKSDSPFRAVSPDGVMYRVRTEKNEPKAELAFWKEALKKRMLDAGYHFLAESDIEASGKAGYLLELTAPVGTQDYTYLIALFERDKHLVIVESAGEVTRFKARREAVVDAIKTISF